MKIDRKIFFNGSGIFALICFGVTLAGYYLNDKSLNLFFETIYFLGICGLLLYLGNLIYLQTKKKEIRENTHLAVSAFIFFGILMVLYGIAAKNNKIFDITENKKYSLSNQTVKVLESLDQQVEILAFLKPNQEGRESFLKMLDRYDYHSDNVSYQTIDPQAKPILAEEYNIERFGQVVVRSEIKSELVEVPTEEEITNAFLKVTSEKSKRIYFLKGHDEPSIDDGEKNGYSLVKRHLSLQNYIATETLLMRETMVPEDADCLVIASPKKEIFDNEFQLIREYLETGKSLLILLDPKVVESLSKFVEELGFDTKENMIVDPMSRLLGGNAFTPVSTQYIPHPITDNFRVGCFFPTVRMVDVKPNFKEGFSGFGFAYTGPGSWAEFDFESLETQPELDEKKDIPGPVSIAAVMEEISDEEEPSKPLTRIVVVGDSNFIDNSNIGLSGNKDLFMNTISWLTRDENLISIRKTEKDSVPIFFNPIQQVFLFVVPLILMPLLALGFGIIKMIRLKKE